MTSRQCDGALLARFALATQLLGVFEIAHAALFVTERLMANNQEAQRGCGDACLTA
jgi:hypothetical protein